MNRDEILKTNKHYWDTYADLWFGTTALPAYGVYFVTEDELHLFGDVSEKKMLEICCGSGYSLKYHADRNAGELWGVDLSHKQLENAKRYLSENGYTANFICSPMEADMDIPKEYFDFVYSIYGIGWTTDLDGTFQKIASYLKKDGIFIFSWHHKEQGLTIFLTSHFMDEVEALCDEICILKKGTPVFCGTVEQAKRRCGCEHFEDAYLRLSDEEVGA